MSGKQTKSVRRTDADNKRVSFKQQFNVNNFRPKAGLFRLYLGNTETLITAESGEEHLSERKQVGNLIDI
jgi:hypothetical protein